MHATTTEKPTWPHGHIVKMYAHATRRWAKKIKGKTEFFGPWDDPDAALREYQRIGPDLHRGIRPRISKADPDALTVGDVCNLFLGAKHSQVNSGELKPGTYVDYRETAKRIIGALGYAMPAASLTPADFIALRAAFARELGTYALGKAVIIARMIFGCSRRQAHQQAQREGVATRPDDALAAPSECGHKPG